MAPCYLSVISTVYQQLYLCLFGYVPNLRSFRMNTYIFSTVDYFGTLPTKITEKWGQTTDFILTLG
jgi:hypothetical protein